MMLDGGLGTNPCTREQLQWSCIAPAFRKETQKQTLMKSVTAVATEGVNYSLFLQYKPNGATSANVLYVLYECFMFTLTHSPE